MTVVLTDNANYSAIASAIRGKNGTQATYAPSEMAAAIAAIPTGGATLGTKSITDNGTYDAVDDNLDGYSQVTVNVPSGGGGDMDILLERTASSVFNSTASVVGYRALASYVALVNVEITSCTHIGYNALTSCSNLTTASFPSCVSISDAAFYGCSKLQDIFAPNCEYLGSSAFAYCYKLSSVSFPKCTLLSTYAFQSCSNLTEVYLPLCSSVSGSAFRDCSKLTTVDLRNCEFIGYYAFSGCRTLSELSLPKLKSLANGVFAYCYNLLSLNLLGVSSVPAMSTNSPFNDTPIGGRTTSTGGQYGSIYVPSSLYDEFLSASIWSALSARIVSV